MVTALGTAFGVALLVGCNSAPDPATPGEPALSALSVADTHVHSIELAGPSGSVVLATHDGLWVQEGNELRQVGPHIDLMSFAVLDPNTYRASGRPGPGIDLGEPVGPIETNDAGQTWSSLSLTGECDFQAA